MVINTVIIIVVLVVIVIVITIMTVAVFPSGRASLASPPSLCCAADIAMAAASPADSSTGSASRGACQPATGDRGTSAAATTPGAPPGLLPLSPPPGEAADFTVASFNFGFEQGMMTGKRSRKHCTNFGRVCAKIVQEAEADLFFACEVGPFWQGLRRAHIHVEDILQEPFGDSVRFAEINNYLGVWGFGGASQPAVVSLHGDAQIHRVPVGRELDVVITRFDVQTSGHGKAHVVVSNMHIVCGTSPPAIIRDNVQ